eukprot:5359709-Amphidinium_carterae.2
MDKSWTQFCSFGTTAALQPVFVKVAFRRDRPRTRDVKRESVHRALVGVRVQRTHEIVAILSCGFQTSLPDRVQHQGDDLWSWPCCGYESRAHTAAVYACSHGPCGCALRQRDDDAAQFA